LFPPFPEKLSSWVFSLWSYLPTSLLKHPPPFDQRRQAFIISLFLGSEIPPGVSLRFSLSRFLLFRTSSYCRSFLSLVGVFLMEPTGPGIDVSRSGFLLVIFSRLENCRGPPSPSPQLLKIFFGTPGHLYTSPDPSVIPVPRPDSLRQFVPSALARFVIKSISQSLNEDFTDPSPFSLCHFALTFLSDCYFSFEFPGYCFHVAGLLCTLTPSDVHLMFYPPPPPSRSSILLFFSDP